MRPSFIYGFAVVAFAFGAVCAADTVVRDHDLEPDDYFTIAGIGAMEMSPDGQFVAYVESRWDKTEDGRVRDLWIVSVASQERERLTFDTFSVGSLHWSPDGKWIYFTSSRKRDDGEKAPYNGKTQVWRIGAKGGDVQPVTRVKDGINGYQLSADGKSLYYATKKKHVAEDPWKDLRDEFDSLEYGHGVVKYSQIWKLDLVSWRERKIVDEERVIGEFSVSPDQRYIAMITTPTAELITNEGWSHVDIFDTKSEEVTTLPDKQWRGDAPSPYGWILGLAWSDDSRAVSFRVDFDGYPGEVYVAEFDDSGHTASHKLSRPNEVYVTGHMEWLPGTRDFCFTADDHGRTRVLCLPGVGGGTQGQAVTLTPGDVSVKNFVFSGDGQQVLTVMGTTIHPPDLFLWRAKGERQDAVRLTNINPQVDTWKLPQIEVVKWKSNDGTECEGILELPPDYKTGERLPMIVELHGGPTSSTQYEFRFWIYGRALFPAKGWALFSPNYRGSTGYGDKFLTDLIGRKNDVDVEDILSGLDAMIERGVADPDKLGVMGWSNGGFLTNCMITNTTRFKAASSGAGVFDTTLQWLEEDTPGHVINFSKGFPWTTDRLRKSSPLYNVDKVTTPTLIHVGENDPRCPPGHSRGLYRSLYHYVKVPTELVVYPGEGHGLTTYKHRKAKMEWDVKWFEHHVLGESEQAPDEPKTNVD